MSIVQLLSVFVAAGGPAVKLHCSRMAATSRQPGRTYIVLACCHLSSIPCALPLPQTYYKLSYVDRRIEQPEQRVCEDVPKLCTGLADLTRECLTAVGASALRLPDLAGLSLTC